MKSLSSDLTPAILRDLKRACAEGKFPEIDFETAMAFLLTDGVLPKSNLPARSFLELEDWIRERHRRASVIFTATDLKNKTGDIIEKVMQGNEVTIERHGKPIIVMSPYK